MLHLVACQHLNLRHFPLLPPVLAVHLLRYGLAMLALPLLVLLPYPVQLIVALQELTTPGPLPFG
jgi:hypothetical protein